MGVQVLGDCEDCHRSAPVGILMRGGQRTMVCEPCFKRVMFERYPLTRTPAEVASDRFEARGCAWPALVAGVLVLNLGLWLVGVVAVARTLTAR